MQNENRQCQNCKRDFIISMEDFKFFEKVSSALQVETISSPTYCPQCRMKRRMIWRNERNWHKRVCDATGKSILSIISSYAPYKVYDQEYWKSDAWDPLAYGREFDFSQNFFYQFDELMKAVPHPNLVTRNCINSDYANYCTDGKNVYFSASFVGAEDCAYLFGAVTESKFSMDLHQCNKSEYSYELIDCVKSYKLFFSQNCEGCVESYFLYDCRNCTNCIGCVGLRSKSYNIFNVQYSKEEYEQKLKELNINTRSGLNAIREKFKELKLEIPRKFAVFIKSNNFTGDDILNSREVYESFYARDVENVKYSFRVWANTKDVYDGVIVWDNAELCYEDVSINAQRVMFSSLIWGGFDVLYSYNCFSCNNIFGCVGLRNKSYCIFNKQYSKEQYEELLKKIITKMKDTKEYGEFFPSNISPFSYNEAISLEYFPLSEEEAKKEGFSWEASEKKNYEISVKSNALPEHIDEVGEDIMKEVIECSHQGKCTHGCTTAFKISNFEFSFYKKFNLPLPTLCAFCRHRERLENKNPLKLWHRTCMCNKNHTNHEGQCEVEFETPYSPERPEKVYCEKCYQQEVY